jgi:hypothetical protein
MGEKKNKRRKRKHGDADNTNGTTITSSKTAKMQLKQAH